MYHVFLLLLRVCVENFNRQIEEYREQLGKERKERGGREKEKRRGGEGEEEEREGGEEKKKRGCLESLFNQT